MPPHPRINWEFQAVVKGRMAPTTAKQEPLARATLWVFPPGVEHGWRGEPGSACEIVSLHFSAVPESMETLVAEQGYSRVRLSRTCIRKLTTMARTLSPHYWQPVLSSDVHVQRALLDLCLLVLRKYPEAKRPRPLGAAFSKVVETEDWLRRNLSCGGHVKDAARAVGLSVSQLDRLFLRIRGETPLRFLTQLRIERAMRLLADPELKLEAVANQCGFSSASNLCRAFKAARGSSPTRWRDETLIRYRRPRRGEEEDAGMHGRRDRRGM